MNLKPLQKSSILLFYHYDHIQVFQNNLYFSQASVVERDQCSRSVDAEETPHKLRVLIFCQLRQRWGREGIDWKRIWWRLPVDPPKTSLPNVVSDDRFGVPLSVDVCCVNEVAPLLYIVRQNHL